MGKPEERDSHPDTGPLGSPPLETAKGADGTELTRRATSSAVADATAGSDYTEENFNF